MKKLLLIFALFITIISCETTDKKTDYETEVLLENLANNFILVNYNQLKNDALELKIYIDSLKQNPTALNLVTAQNQFVETYKSFQKISVYNFGPAIDNGQSSLNIFPANSSTINNNISAGGYDLASGANVQAIGFPALDYLLFHEDNINLISKFSDLDYSQYALDVAEQIYQKTNAIYSTWENSYQATFIANKGNQTGSSISVLANAYILNFERNGREAKIGIPAGVRSLNEVKPENVEAYYSEKSIVLAKEHILALKAIYEGNGNVSFQSVLKSVDQEQLANNINAQFDAILLSLNTLSDPFSDMLTADNQAALAVYSEYQKLLPLLKVDMTAALGLLINYSDSDGD